MHRRPWRIESGIDRIHWFGAILLIHLTGPFDKLCARHNRVDASMHQRAVHLKTHHMSVKAFGTFVPGHRLHH